MSPHTQLKTYLLCLLAPAVNAVTESLSAFTSHIRFVLPSDCMEYDKYLKWHEVNSNYLRIDIWLFISTYTTLKTTLRE